MTTQEQIADRRHRFGRHFPTSPARGSQVPLLLRGHREFRVLDQERDELFETEKRVFQQSGKVWREYDAAVVAYRSERTAALLAGQMPPGPLPEPNVPRWMKNEFDEAHRSIEAAELGLLVGDADRWREELAKPAAKANAKVEVARRQLQLAEGEADAIRRQIETLEGLCPAVIEVGGIEVGASEQLLDSQGHLRRLQEAFVDSRRAPRRVGRGR